MPQLGGSATGGAVGLDPSGFQISVIMNTTDGVRIPLWMKGLDDGDGNPLSAGLGAAAGAGGGIGGFGSGSGGTTLSSADLLNLDLPIVESVTTELSLGLVGKITVETTATYDLGLKLLDSPFFAIGNTVEVQMGYPRSKRFTRWLSGLTAKPSIRVSPDEGLTATINVEGGGFAAFRGSSNRTFEGRSYREIIEEIAIENEWDFELPGDSIVARIVADTGTEVSDFLKVREVVSQQNMNDWFFIQYLCNSSGCNAFMGPSDDNRGRYKLFVKERKSAFSLEPRFKFISRGQSDFAKVFPLLEFETEAEFVWLPGGAVKTTTRDIHHDDKRVMSFDATAETSGEPALGDAGAPTGAARNIEGNKVKLVNTDGAGRTGEFMVVSCRDPRGAPAVAQSHRDQLAVRGGITAKATSFGVPELLPGEVVQLDALGVFNSVYGVNSLTHTANDSEWTMSMELINNASGSGIFQRYFVKDQEKTNTGTVDEEGGVSGDETDVDAVPGGI